MKLLALLPFLALATCAAPEYDASAGYGKSGPYASVGVHGQFGKLAHMPK